MINGTKILFIGPMGAGKTTAITCISDDPPIKTEASNSARHISDKQTTTVAMDFGRIYMDQFNAIDLYGIPGQEHFDFLWPILEKGALGAIFLLNCDTTDQIIQNNLEKFCNDFSRLRDNSAIVIALNRANEKAVSLCHNWLRENDIVLPVLMADPRNRDDIIMTLELLIATAEVDLLPEGEIHDAG